MDPRIHQPLTLNRSPGTVKPMAPMDSMNPLDPREKVDKLMMDLSSFEPQSWTGEVWSGSRRDGKRDGPVRGPTRDKRVKRVGDAGNNVYAFNYSPIMYLPTTKPSTGGKSRRHGSTGESKRAVKRVAADPGVGGGVGYGGIGGGGIGGVVGLNGVVGLGIGFSVGGGGESNEMAITTKINYPINSLTKGIPPDRAEQIQQVLQSIERKKYSTSALDPARGYLSVYEYNVNDQSIIWDYDTGYVHLTGIWKASIRGEVGGPKNSKADIVKLLESTPRQYQPVIKRIRGGFLKIQGTWVPWDMAKVLAKRFCYYIRYQLVPIFGANFPEECLKPEDVGFGELRLLDAADLRISGAAGRFGDLKRLRIGDVVEKRMSGGVLMQSPMILDKISPLSSNFPQDQLNCFNPSSGLYQLSPRESVFAVSPVQGYHGRSFSFPPPTISEDSLGCSKTPVLHQLQSYSDTHSNGMVIGPRTQFSAGDKLQQLLVNGFNSSLSPYSETFTTPTRSRSLTMSLTRSLARSLIKSVTTSMTKSPQEDLLDIVNASKCLQSLSRSSQSPPGIMAAKSTNNYTTSPRSEVNDPDSSSDGITSILLAAGISDETNPPEIATRGSIKINDLLC